MPGLILKNISSISFLAARMTADGLVWTTAPGSTIELGNRKKSIFRLPLVYEALRYSKFN